MAILGCFLVHKLGYTPLDVDPFFVFLRYVHKDKPDEQLQA